jgi:hypothetical protein
LSRKNKTQNIDDTKQGLYTEKRSKFLAILTCIFCFVLCITLADLFSTIITVGSFSGGSGGKISPYSIFAVTLYQGTVKSSALEHSVTIKKTNGAGYVWEDDGTFYVIASAYKEENDANKVKENLTNSNYNVEVLKISIDEIAISKNYTNEELNSLLSAGNLFKETFKSLYDISISLDTEIISETQCRLEISNLQSEVGKIKNDFEVMFNAKLSPVLLQLKLSINSVSTLIQQLIDFESSNQQFSSKIKYNYIEILSINQKLAKQINAI